MMTNPTHGCNPISNRSTGDSDSRKPSFAQWLNERPNSQEPTCKPMCVSHAFENAWDHGELDSTMAAAVNIRSTMQPMMRLRP